MANRGLVLGGGGPVGIAWEAGLTAGLHDAGVALADADFILGTSAGSVVGAELALGRSPAELFQNQLAQTQRGAGRDVNRPAGSAPDLRRLMELMEKRPQRGSALEDWFREIGSFALETKTVSEDAFVASLGHLVHESWPHKRFACTAVDAEAGTFRLWDNDAGAPLAQAVASSCSVPGIFPPITIDGHRYIDGGMRSATNADLASGCERVIVVSVMSTLTTEAERRRQQAELEAIRDAGGDALVVSPDGASSAAFGPNLMDSAKRAGAAEAGRAQGRREAARVAAFWN